MTAGYLCKWIASVTCGAFALSMAIYCGAHAKVVAASSFQEPASSKLQSDEQDGLVVEQRARAVICGHCIMCHNDHLRNGELSLEHRETIMRGGTLGPVLVPGDPENSLMVHAVRRDGRIAQMMPPGPKLADEDIAALARWIGIGAPISADPVCVRRPEYP